MEEKRGKGRPPGAVSLVNVRFGDLKKYISDEMLLPVGKVFLDRLGLTNALIVSPTNPQKAESPSKAEITILKYDVPS